ncbi:PepSY domain-containing protein [Mesobacillus maritimus]|uniref:PepSY domain-containing protein n=1 Tax=Mesobacillus maritimus TaxID=1643336 RepID=A0ABS7KC37_9BACI|nr:PepSY domain-containing protein [Mesobacillus maritimus]MBY0099631.1 PepSY domain-containing protein [Mesobacillus maritimus]
MFKRLLVTGCTLLLLAACGTDTTEENAGTTNQASPTSENNASNTNNDSTVTNDSSNEDTQNTSNQTDITNPAVSMEEAVKVFQEAHPDAKVESIDFDNDSGRLHYDFDGFDSSKEYEMEIDASTKEIKEREVEKDRDKDES